MPIKLIRMYQGEGVIQTYFLRQQNKHHDQLVHYMEQNIMGKTWYFPHNVSEIHIQTPTTGEISTEIIIQWKL